MTNVNAAFGFMPYGYEPGRTPNFGLRHRKIAYNNTNKLFRGDPVVSLGTGYIDIATAGTTQIAGIFWGVKYYSVSNKITLESQWWNGGSDVLTNADVSAVIIDDPDMRFVAQSNGTAIAFADNDANINFASGTGNQLTGQSAYTLDQSTISTVSTRPFRILGLLSAAAPPGTNGTDDTSNYNQAIVRFNYTDRTSQLGIV